MKMKSNWVNVFTEGIFCHCVLVFQVADLEECRRAQQVTLETLTSQLAAVKADHSKREKELGEKRGLLQPEETQLRVRQRLQEAEGS